MNTTHRQASLRRSFWNGLLRGMSAPFFAFVPRQVRTEFAEEVLKTSYIDPSADRENIRNDFLRVVHRAEQDLNSHGKQSE
mgnify:CR=1